MFAKNKLYYSFKKDLNILIENYPGCIWLNRLMENTRTESFKNYRVQQNIVDRIDEELKDVSQWNNIKTAYGLRGTYKG